MFPKDREGNNIYRTIINELTKKEAEKLYDTLQEKINRLFPYPLNLHIEDRKIHDKFVEIITKKVETMSDYELQVFCESCGMTMPWDNPTRNEPDQGE